MEAGISWLTAIVLAVVQGATEFIPVSSSAHLVIGAQVLGAEQLPLAYAVIVHLGTLVAVFLYYWRDLAQIGRSLVTAGARVGEEAGEGCRGRRLLGMLLLATVPAGVAGVLVADHVDALLSKPLPAGLLLIVTATFLALADRAQGTKTPDQASWLDALLVGVGQMVAILPGVSRSGTTVWAGLSRGFSPLWAPKFSFLLSIPVILGAGLIEAKDMLENPLPAGEMAKYGVAGLVACVVGYVSIHLVVQTVRRGRLFRRFGIYCLAVSGLTVTASLLGYWQ